jgi:hypothetical protein
LQRAKQEGGENSRYEQKINGANNIGYTPCWLAMENSKREVFKLLLDALPKDSKTIFTRARGRYNVAHLAIEKSFANEISMLLARYPQLVLETDKEDGVLMSWARHHGNLDIIGIVEKASYLLLIEVVATYCQNDRAEDSWDLIKPKIKILIESLGSIPPVCLDSAYTQAVKSLGQERRLFDFFIQHFTREKLTFFRSSLEQQLAEVRLESARVELADEVVGHVINDALSMNLLQRKERSDALELDRQEEVTRKKHEKEVKNRGTWQRLVLAKKRSNYPKLVKALRGDQEYEEVILKLNNLLTREGTYLSLEKGKYRISYSKIKDKIRNIDFLAPVIKRFPHEIRQLATLEEMRNILEEVGFLFLQRELIFLLEDMDDIDSEVIDEAKNKKELVNLINQIFSKY